MSELKETGEGKPADGLQDLSDADVVDRMIKDFEEKIKGGKVNLTVGDFIRLVQLRKDFHAEAPKEVRVTWVNPPERESASKT